MPLYKIKINHKVTDDKGAEKFANDTYVVEATSVIDAQAKLIESDCFAEYSIEAITKPRINRVLQSDDGGSFYRIKIVALSGDDDKVRCIVFLLVQALDFDTAVAMAKVYAGSAPYELEFVQLTPIAGFVR